MRDIRVVEEVRDPARMVLVEVGQVEQVYPTVESSDRDAKFSIEFVVVERLSSAVVDVVHRPVLSSDGASVKGALSNGPLRPPTPDLHLSFPYSPSLIGDVVSAGVGVFPLSSSTAHITHRARLLPKRSTGRCEVRFL